MKAKARALKIDESRVHGHHIIMKNMDDEWTVKSKKLFEELKIPLHQDHASIRKSIKAKEDIPNLAFALNGVGGIHSKTYARAVYNRLAKARESALLNGLDEKKDVIDALKEMGDILEQGEIFW